MNNTTAHTHTHTQVKPRPLERPLVADYSTHFELPPSPSEYENVGDAVKQCCLYKRQNKNIHFCF